MERMSLCGVFLFLSWELGVCRWTTYYCMEYAIHLDFGHVKDICQPTAMKLLFGRIILHL